MSDRPKISLITITRDEEALIAQCLKSAWFCDEKIIIDSFSTDKTVDLGSFGPVGRSETELRFFHLATVFGLTP